eukprot:g22031.t1
MNRERYHAASPAFDWSKVAGTPVKENREIEKEKDKEENSREEGSKNKEENIGETATSSWKERLAELQQELTKLRQEHEETVSKLKDATGKLEQSDKERMQLDNINKEQKTQLELMTRVMLEKSRKAKRRKASPRKDGDPNNSGRRMSVEGLEHKGGDAFSPEEISRPTSAQSMRSWLERPLSMTSDYNHSPATFVSNGRAGLGRAGSTIGIGPSAGLIGMGPVSVEFGSPGRNQLERERINSGDAGSITSERSVRSTAPPKASGKEVQGAFEFMQDVDA